MLTTNKTGISRFIEIAVSQGMRHVVCSPGSRNAPLVIAIDNHPDIETVIVPDERSAGFIAMGMAQQLEAPVAVVCTSGSAVLNYFPAVAEAYYQGIPLVVLSADRPKEWINHGDGQTIMQEAVFGEHIRSYSAVPEFVDDGDFDQYDDPIKQAFQIAKGDHFQLSGPTNGPIHFNFHLSEPLYETVEIERPSFEKDVSEEKSRNFDLQSYEDSVSKFEELLDTDWNKSKKRMILCGQMNPDTVFLNALIELAEDASVAVIVENTANLSYSKFMHCIDRSLSAISEDEIQDFQPDLLITFGEAIVSKRIKKFLREVHDLEHWKIGGVIDKMDTYRHLKFNPNLQPEKFVRMIQRVNKTQHVSQYGWKWKQKDFLIQDKLPSYVQSAPYSDLTVFDVVLDSIPDNAYLHMANSSVVRYCQLFDPIKSIRYFANRGTSGIDGSSSTAVGASIAKKDDLHVLISGDLSFFYDSNAFWNNAVGENLRTIVINNGGGGIFRIIDGPNATQQLERYFETENNASVKGICDAYRMEYLSASSLSEVESQVANLLTMDTKGRPAVLEIFTPNDENNAVLKNFFKHFKSL